jgi:hypothetical protein
VLKVHKDLPVLKDQLVLKAQLRQFLVHKARKE